MIRFLVASGLVLPDAWDVVRVETLDHPDAIGHSPTASILPAAPTDGTPWKFEPFAEVDSLESPQTLGVTNADLWHSDGATGQGVRVAVFDIGWYGPAADLSELDDFETHDCWAHPSCEWEIDPVRPRFAYEDGNHGIACAEAVREVAPDAELHLVRTSNQAAFENGVQWAIREGIDVITMSMSFYNSTFYAGEASVFDDLLHDLEAHDVLLVTSAGNSARDHWVGPYIDANGDGRMDFDGDDHLLVDLKGGSNTLYVNWNQHGRCGDTDLDARVVDNTGTIYGASTLLQSADAKQCQPIERVLANVPAPGVYALEVTHEAGHLTDVEVDIITRSGEVVHNMPERSLGDPAAHPLAFSVGAVRADGYLDNGPEGFSSQGPNNGGHPKPDIAGPDGLTTTAFGASGFFGTSASSPVVAGLVAVVMSDDPTRTPRESAILLQGWAWRETERWDDPRWGAGKARLPVRDPVGAACGRRPLLALMFIPPWGLFRRVRRREEVAEPQGHRVIRGGVG